MLYVIYYILRNLYIKKFINFFKKLKKFINIIILRNNYFLINL